MSSSVRVGAGPTLIVGAGLAGIHLAWSLYLKRQPFRIISLDSGKPAWKASAGIINPITGKRVVKSWRIDELLPFAIARYREIAEIMQRENAYQALPLIRYFRDDSEERERFQERCRDTEYRAYLGDQSTPDGFIISHSGWADVSTFVKTSREFFKDRGYLSELDQPFQPSSISLESHGIRWDYALWQHIVFCEGYHGAINPYFNWLDYRISRGDVLDFSINTSLPEHILNREKWLLPLSPNTGRVGSTYTWENLEDVPKTQDAVPLLEAWQDHIPDITQAQIRAHRIGIRSGTNDSKPYAGPHPSDPRFCILNGLGSKGASQGPWCAERLARYLVSGEALPKDIDPGRRLKFLKSPPPHPSEILS